MFSRRRFLELLFGLSFPRQTRDGLLPTRPYLQHLRRDRAVLCWCSALAETEVRITGARQVGLSVRGWSPAQTDLEADLFVHRAEISGFSSDRPHHVGLLRLGEPQEHRLLLRPPGAGIVRFLVFGDSGSGSEPQRQLARLMEGETPDLILHTGDLAYPAGSFGEFLERHLAVYETLLACAPMYPCPGNHEYVQPGARAYLALHALPEEGVPPQDRGRYYSFDWGPVHFVSLDSNAPLLETAEGRDGMLSWLEQDLAQARQPWKVAYFHHPPYAGGVHEADPLCALARKLLAPILERYGVRLVFNGHEHSYQRSRPLLGGQAASASAGVVYVTTGGGGGGLYPAPGQERLEVCSSRFHYLRVSAAAEWMQVEAVGLGGDVFDSFTLASRRGNRNLALGRAPAGAVISA